MVHLAVRFLQRRPRRTGHPRQLRKRRRVHRSLKQKISHSEIKERGGDGYSRVDFLPAICPAWFSRTAARSRRRFCSWNSRNTRVATVARTATSSRGLCRGIFPESPKWPRCTSTFSVPAALFAAALAKLRPKKFLFESYSRWMVIGYLEEIVVFEGLHMAR